MMKKPMTKDIAETKSVTYKSHKIITDDEGFIIGVQTEWQ